MERRASASVRFWVVCARRKWRYRFPLCFRALLSMAPSCPLHIVLAQLLSDNIRPTIMSLLFFLTIFRTQFNAVFFAAVVLLLLSKAALWVTEARVHFMEQSPADSRLVYWRLGSLITLLAWVNGTVTSWAAQHTLQYGPSLVLLFGCVEVVVSIFVHFLLILTAVAVLSTAFCSSARCRWRVTFY